MLTLLERDMTLGRIVRRFLLRRLPEPFVFWYVEWVLSRVERSLVRIQRQIEKQGDA